MNIKTAKNYLIIVSALTMLSLSQASSAEEFAATLHWSQRVELSASVNGVIQDVFAVPGKIVAKGESLVQLDPRVFKADLKFAKAALKNADEQNQEAKRELDRQADMYDRTMLSDHDLQIAKNNYTATQALFNQAQASVTKAKLHLEYSAVRAPFNAIVINTKATKGQVVAVEMAPPVLVVVAEANRMVARFFAAMATVNKLVAGQGVSVSVEGTNYQGTILNLALEPDVSKQGQYAVDVIFDSKNKLLRAGQNAQVSM